VVVVGVVFLLFWWVLFFCFFVFCFFVLLFWGRDGAPAAGAFGFFGGFFFEFLWCV